MLESGDFGYRCNKYMYIERYMIPMLDSHGYAELVVHPPPINYLAALLIPFTFNNTSMETFSIYYSRMIFWLENIYYIIEKFISLLFLVPFIFARTIFNVVRVATPFNGF